MSKLRSEHKQTETSKQDNCKVLPVSNESVGGLALPPLPDEVLAGEDEPEHEKVGLEHALLDVIEQVDPGHVVSQGEILEREIEERESGSQ